MSIIIDKKILLSNDDRENLSGLNSKFIRPPFLIEDAVEWQISSIEEKREKKTFIESIICKVHQWNNEELFYKTKKKMEKGRPWDDWNVYK